MLRGGFFVIAWIIVSLAVGSLAGCKPRAMPSSTAHDTAIENLPYDPRQQIWFHWGSAEANQTLLDAGAKNAQGRTLMDAGVFRVIDGWYAHNRNDAAGSGFYVANQMSSSADYGKDLLLVRMNYENAPPTIPYEGNFKNRSDHARNRGLMNELPLIVHYQMNAGWYVLPRPTNQHEHVEVSFERPRSGDAAAVWGWMINTLNPYGVFIDIPRLIKHFPAQTPAAKELFGEILHRYAPSYLVQVDYGKLAFEELIDGGRAIKSLWDFVGGNHEVLRRGAATYVERMYSPEIAPRLQPAMALELVDVAWPHLHAEIKAKALQQFEVVLRSGEPINFAQAVQIIEVATNDPVFTHRGEGYKQQLERLIQEGKVKVAAPINLLALESAKRVFGNSRGVQVVAQAEVARQAEVMSHSAYDIQRQANIWSNSDIYMLVEFQNAYIEAMRRPAGEHLRQAVPAMQSAMLLGVVGNIAQDPGRLEPLQKDFARRLGQMLQESKPHWVTVETVLVSLNRYASVNGFRNMASTFIRIFPEQAVNFIGAIDQLLIGGSNNTILATLETELVQIRNELEQIRLSNPHASASGVEARLAAAFVRLPAEVQAAYGKDAYFEQRRRLLQPTLGSEAYSEIARSYILVDPIFIAEDMRVNNASRPYERFNESFFDGNITTQQPTWRNFIHAWDFLATDFYDDVKGTTNMRMAELVQLLHVANRISLVGRVEGAPAMFDMTDNWDRAKYVTKISAAEWADTGAEMQRAELAKFFNITNVADGVELRFRTTGELRGALPAATTATFSIESKSIAALLLANVAEIADPMRRAAKILQLMPRLHPFENGNGRLTRTWAAMTLVRAGLPVPVGLPTNDFLLTEERIYWEVRKAVAIGKHWQAEVESARKAGVAPDAFFQTRVRGKPIEGLILSSFSNLQQLQKVVYELETSTTIPKWAQNIADMAEAGIYQLRGRHQSIGNMDEVGRDRWQRELTREAFQKEGLPWLEGVSGPCEALRSGVAGVL